jgi:glucose/arabinose dehydrogenase
MKRAVLVASAILGGATSLTGQTKPTVQITSHVVEPAKLALTDEAMTHIRVPDGFRVSLFAKDLGNPRILAVAADGSVYVTRRDEGDVILLKDADHDGHADPPLVVARRPRVHGIAVTNNQVYLATVKEIFVADRHPDGGLGELRRIIDDLPDGGQHPNRTLGIGPDGMLYISVGSSCNSCDETNPEHAAMLRAKLDGSSRTIFASGLRNTIGFAWHPTTGELWGMDHGIDFLGDDEQKEELNHLTMGKQYGWPYIYADNHHNPHNEPPGEISLDQWARMSQTPEMFYTAHAAPMQMTFYSGAQFPADYRSSAFVAMRGSWNRTPPSGYEVVRIRFTDGKPVSFEPFMTGLLVDHGNGSWGYLGRPVGVAVAQDGSLLVSDDKNGAIYRIAYGDAKGRR